MFNHCLLAGLNGYWVLNERLITLSLLGQWVMKLESTINRSKETLSKHVNRHQLYLSVLGGKHDLSLLSFIIINVIRILHVPFKFPMYLGNTNTCIELF